MSKYHNKEAVVDGIRFDSHKEANYYCLLKMLKAGGEVKNFDRQVTYELQPSFSANGKKYRPIRYVADFVVEYKDGHVEVVDVKGFRTKEYMLKRKILLFRHPEMVFVEA